ncbi:DUF4157 domain-containing protein [Longimicrobium sp.]|uniref:eCIS core domain-containing protein n=1 Tax=Longimicrobium sp. TaxID=2029185 RepID=UPI002C2A1976|nr:DUF4157 domain-containing protein [Longimicrobium sp.]HSU16113.1 DUF4157 domain-containing protein [Longimicrobium sp.]
MPFAPKQARTPRDAAPPAPAPARTQSATPPRSDWAPRGPGQPLAPPVRASMERRFGHDFARVRIHAGDEGARAAASAGALAYAAGSSIVFARGQYAPHTAAGERLLAHELAHVVQTGGRAPGAPAVPGRPDGAAERAADGAASRVAAGRPAGPLRAAAPAVHRKGVTLTIPQIKRQIAEKGHDDITALARLIPDSGNGKARIREATVGGAKHVFNLQFNIQQQSIEATLLMGNDAETVEAVSTTGTPPSQTVNHDIRMTFPSNMAGDGVTTIFHELVHARIILDRQLPESERGDTFRRYAQQMEMASDPALLAATGTSPKKAAVISAIQSLRAGLRAVPGFDESRAARHSSDDELYEFLVNEKFTNTEASTVVGGTATPAGKVAKRYAAAVRSRLQSGLRGDALTTFKAGKLAGLVDDREKALTDALVALYAALDEQLASIAKMKKEGIPGASPNPLPDFSPGIRPAPVDITGKPVPAGP